MKRITVVLPVLAPTPFLRSMTEFCIATMKVHADQPFDLIVVEAEHSYFDPEKCEHLERPVPPEFYPWGAIDKYFNFTPKIGGVKESNVGIRAAETEFVLTTGNDVIVPPHWDTELLRVFDERPRDCGIASLSAFEPGTVIGPPESVDMIVEGMYSPFNMFRRGWEYDEAFQRVYQDSDLILRMYEKDLRAFRSCRAHVHHLLRMTNDRVASAAHNAQLEKDEALFYQRWGKSPLAMFGLIRATSYTYSKEYLSFLQPVAGGNPMHPANRRLG